MIINQPKSARIGDVLRSNLTLTGEDSFDRFYVVVAYVKKSGVLSLQNEITGFRRRGGRVTAVVGVDDRNTSKEGLELLKTNVDEAYVYHNQSPYHTFHPKLYAFEKESMKALVIVGSGNLTQGGLFANYELANVIEFDLTDAQENEGFEDVLRVIREYSDVSSPCCRLLDSDMISRLEARGMIETEQIQNVRSITDSERSGESPPLFGTEAIETPPPIGVEDEPYEAIEGFWKQLSAFDVSRTSSPGQIIIPFRFLAFFPTMSTLETTPVGARQADAFFNVIFKDYGGNVRRVQGARAIHYVPAPTHLRPNQELRFTFRDREVFDQLRVDDILVFRRARSDRYWFEISVLPSDSDENRQLRVGGTRFGVLD